jgi:hypothetical protein
MTFILQEMGITEEFYQKTILVCLDELIHSSQVTVKDTGDANIVQELTFSILKRCDKCNKYLKEIVHQQFFCQGMCTLYSALLLQFNC